MMTPWAIRTIRRDSRRMTSMSRGSLWCSAAQSAAAGDGATSSSRTIAPSAFETIFCATTKTSPIFTVRVALVTAFAITVPRSAPRAISGSPGTPTTWISGKALTDGVDLLGLDLHDHAHFTGLAVRIFVLAEILLRQLVDVRVRALFRHLDDAPPDAEIAVRIVGIGNRERDTWIAFEILRLDASARGVDENVDAVEVPPDGRDLRTAISVHRREIHERFLVDEIGVRLGNSRHRCLRIGH